MLTNDPFRDAVLWSGQEGGENRPSVGWQTRTVTEETGAPPSNTGKGIHCVAQLLCVSLFFFCLCYEISLCIDAQLLEFCFCITHSRGSGFLMYPCFQLSWMPVRCRCFIFYANVIPSQILSCQRIPTVGVVMNS